MAKIRYKEFACNSVDASAGQDPKSKMVNKYVMGKSIKCGIEIQI